MWAEIIFSRDDLARALGQAFPLAIQLGETDVQHSLALSELGEVSLVPDVGLRVVCKAELQWPVLGIHVPIVLRELKVILHPDIGKGPDGDILVFRVSIEHADFSALPTFVDNGITSAINAKLASKDAELSWNFSKTLTFNVPLPAMLESLSSFAAKPAWGKVRISEEAVVYAASFHSALVRRGEEVPSEIAAAPEEPASTPPEPSAPLLTQPELVSRPVTSSVARSAANAGVFGLAAGFGYFALRAAFGSRQRR